MGWRDALQSIKGAAEKKGLSAQQHLDLPFGARVGGLVQLQKTPFVRAISNGSFIEMPTDAQNHIKAISRMNLAISGSVYRYYLSLVDSGSKEVFLQVYVNPEGVVGDIIYCSQLTRITPETEDDQNLFMGISGAGLGDKNYCLWREQLAELGYGEADLHAAFGTDEAIEYWRDAGDPEVDFIPPFIGSEMRLDSVQGLKQDIYYMPYRRELKKDIAGNLEYLFIATEVAQGADGDVGKREIHVDFMIGIPLDQEHLVIQ